MDVAPQRNATALLGHAAGKTRCLTDKRIITTGVLACAVGFLTGPGNLGAGSE
jgi:hypothetical protein